MKIEIAEHERMSESGSSLLRLIQNNDTCRLDLLVRESLQNCLDAGDQTHESVRVDYRIGKAETGKISGFFEDITESLNSQFPGEHTFIEIRDTHTNGLTGPVRYSDIGSDGRFGNLLKLIYEISKPQDQSGSGGSWGLGKTVYFRIGIGLVLYYSRIRNDDGSYESRLAAALVEDETKSNHLLPQRSNLQRGIAWWGREDPKGTGKHTIPLSESEELAAILNGFDVQPFQNDETGTMILIPFVDPIKLLEETVPAEAEAENKIPYWCRTEIADYLKIAFQRWYAPRIDNPQFRGQYLELYLNGEKLEASGMEPVFSLIQKLYNSSPDNTVDFCGKPINCKPIELRNVFERGSARSGYINYLKVTAAELKMEEPYNYPNPYYYINRLSSDTMYNDPIIAFVRKPGMIVSYATTGDWTDSIPKAAIGEYIVGLFVPNSDNRLSQFDMSLEDYLRGSEKADHMGWEDWAVKGKNPQIIARIKKGVRKKIKDDFPTMTAGSEESRNLGLGKMLADFLLPPTGYVFWDEATGGTKGPGGTGGSGESQGGGTGGSVNTTSHAVLKITGNSIFDEYGIKLPIRILMGKKRKISILMQVDTERGTISYEDWRKNVGTTFPIEINSFTVNKITSGKGKQTVVRNDQNVIIDHTTELSGILFSFNEGESNMERVSLTILTDIVDNIVIDGMLSYKLNDVQGAIILQEEM